MSIGTIHPELASIKKRTPKGGKSAKPVGAIALNRVDILDVCEPWPMSVKQYLDAIEAGILGERDRVELLEGILVRKTPIGDGHVLAVNMCNLRLMSLVLPDCFVQIQGPAATGASMPEPDVLVVRGNPRSIVSGRPTALDTPLLIEVSDSSLLADRTVKKEIYARAKFPIYWIVNLPERCVEVYTKPRGVKDADYRECVIYS